MDAVFSFHSPESIAPVICAKSDKHGTMLDSLKLDMIFITQNNNCNAIVMLNISLPKRNLIVIIFVILI